MIQLIVYGNPITKKNARPIYIKSDGKRFIGKSKALADYEADILMQLLQQRQELKKENLAFPISARCCIKYSVYLNSNRKRDCTNIVEAAQDALVKAGIITDDNYTILNPVIILVNAGRAFNAHIMIDLIPYQEYINQFVDSKPLPM